MIEMHRITISHNAIFIPMQEGRNERRIFWTSYGTRPPGGSGYDEYHTSCWLEAVHIVSVGMEADSCDSLSQQWNGTSLA